VEQTFQSTKVLGSRSAFAAEHSHAEASLCLRVVSGELPWLQRQRGPKYILSSGCGQPFQA